MGSCFSTSSITHFSDTSLSECTKDNTPKWSLAGRTQPGKVVHIVDGDTVDVAIVLDQRFVQFRVRLYGIDTPEKAPSKLNLNRLEEMAASHAATDALTRLLQLSSNMVDIHFRHADKYGRWLCDLYRRDGTNHTHINAWMLEQGHAKPYFGGKKES